MLSHAVVNQTTATFKNVLTVDKEFVDMIGNYSCSVVNIVFGSSERKTIHLKGSSCVGTGSMNDSMNDSMNNFCSGTKPADTILNIT